MGLTVRDSLARVVHGRGGKIVRFVRYSVGSALATAVSAVVFAMAYHVHGIGPEISSIAAFLSGALVNFSVSRLWTWRGPRRRRVSRDALGFAVIAVLTALAATVATSVTEGYARRTGMTPTGRAILVEGAYFFVYAAMFLIKFALLDRVVFRYQHASQDPGTEPAHPEPAHPEPARSGHPRQARPGPSYELAHSSGEELPASKS